MARGPGQGSAQSRSKSRNRKIESSRDRDLDCQRPLSSASKVSCFDIGSLDVWFYWRVSCSRVRRWEKGRLCSELIAWFVRCERVLCREMIKNLFQIFEFYHQQQLNRSSGFLKISWQKNIVVSSENWICRWKVCVWKVEKKSIKKLKVWQKKASTNEWNF